MKNYLFLFFIAFLFICAASISLYQNNKSKKLLQKTSELLRNIDRDILPASNDSFALILFSKDELYNLEQSVLVGEEDLITNVETGATFYSNKIDEKLISISSIENSLDYKFPEKAKSILEYHQEFSKKAFAFYKKIISDEKLAGTKEAEAKQKTFYKNAIKIKNDIKKLQDIIKQELSTKNQELISKTEDLNISSSSQTIYMVIVFVIALSALVHIVLRITNEQKKLEEQVSIRTDSLTQAIEEKEKLQAELVIISRKSGMSEIASNILHNIGNAMNGVNVLSQLLSKNNNNDIIGFLSKVAKLLKDNEDNLAEYFTNNPKKAHLIISAIEETISSLENKDIAAKKDFGDLITSVNHVISILTRQQKYATGTIMLEMINPYDAFIDSIDMFFDQEKEIIKFKHEEFPQYSMDRHKIMQILINFIKNAIESTKEAKVKGIVECMVSTEEKHIIFSVKDNGLGIKKENLSKMFAQGFTTKKNGHGFGLHDSGNLATEMNGQATVISEGSMKGATFSLKVPKNQ